MKAKLLKTTAEILQSQQIDEEAESLFGNRDGILEPSFDFETLLQAYEYSSIISGIIGKIAIKTATPFVQTENENLRRVLENLDIESITLDMLIFWNAFFERLKTRNWNKTLSFKHIIAPTVRIAKKKKWQKVRNPFFYQRSQNNSKKVGLKRSDVLFFHRNSIADPLYGDSIFASSIDEIVLLSYITKHFKHFFKNGNISPNILYDEWGNMTDEQIEKVENMIKDQLAWIENSHTTIFLKGKVWKIDLATIFDPEKYIALKRELKEDISIDLNIPFDLLSSKNSNRANSEVAMSLLYDDIIIPLQNRILKQLKKQFLDWFETEKNEPCWEWITKEEIEAIEFEDINLTDPVKEMQTLTGYQKNGILSVNEVRSIARLGESIEWGDEYKIISQKDEWGSNAEIQKIRNNISKMYAKK